MPYQLTDLLWEDIVFKHIFPCLPLDALFCLRGCSHQCKAMVDGYFACMNKLSLPDRVRLNVEAFEVLSRLCVNLRSVLFESVPFLTTPHLEPLFLKNHKIESLILIECNNLTSACLQNVALYCQNLKVLKLRRCNWVSPGLLHSLALHQPNIEHLELSHCESITASSLNTFLSNLKRLRFIELNHITHAVEDSTLYIISEFCKEVEGIYITRCPTVTHGALSYLGNCPKLKCVLAIDCQRLPTTRYVQFQNPLVPISRSPKY